VTERVDVQQTGFLAAVLDAKPTEQEYLAAASAVLLLVAN
jgi:hypothetical protein